LAFIKERLHSGKTHARVIPWASTAAAAISLLEDDTGEEGHGAAICSKAVVELFPDKLEVLYEGTQGITSESSGTRRHECRELNVARQLHSVPSSQADRIAIRYRGP
jgi:hypothetical protein